MAIEAGVKVAMGTDSGVSPHGQNLRELEQYVLCGMSPTEALVSATRTASELMSIDDEVGTITPGKRADLVIARCEPLDVVALRSSITSVWQDGRRVA